MVDIQLTDITTGTVDGTGVFDKLMSSVKEHIKEEYENGRIKGPEYAQVYLGALQGVLGQSIEYILREKITEVQVEGALKDIELKEAQKLTAYVERIIKDKEATALGLDNAMKLNEDARKGSPSYIYTPIYKDTE